MFSPFWQGAMVWYAHLWGNTWMLQSMSEENYLTLCAAWVYVLFPERSTPDWEVDNAAPTARGPFGEKDHHGKLDADWVKGSHWDHPTFRRPAEP